MQDSSDHAVRAPCTAQTGLRQTPPVPVPPRPLKEEVDDRVDHRAVTSGHWPALTEVDTRWRGSFGYFAALVGPEEEQERILLCRIEYLGGKRWAFALYDPASDSYISQLLRGQWEGSPDDAFETAALVHLSTTKHERAQDAQPEQDLRPVLARGSP